MGHITKNKLILICGIKKKTQIVDNSVKFIVKK